ncbi:hypothetical protein [Salinibacterium sp. SWN248]|nr:hypothetical protein [Salinibacterium sp. SWN248]MBH0024968.1 hypothetical protein [Salinibacterium sp. SWN248]
MTAPLDGLIAFRVSDGLIAVKTCDGNKTVADSIGGSQHSALQPRQPRFI